VTNPTKGVYIVNGRKVVKWIFVTETYTEGLMTESM
jgi:hypothetical protein